MTLLSRRALVTALVITGTGLSSAARTQTSQQTNATATLFENVRIFDGKSAALSTPSSVLVRGNKIENISTSPVASIAAAIAASSMAAAAH